MNDLLIRTTECDNRRVAWRGECLFHAWSPIQQPDAFAAIFEGLDKIIDSGELADELARHDDFCELAALVAVIRKLQRELADRDATDADRGVLNELRRSANPWIHREAGNLLMLIADERDQVAAHDGGAGLAADPGEDSGSDLVGVECWVWWKGSGLATIEPKVGIIARIDTYGWYEAIMKDGVQISGNHARPISMGKPEVTE